MRLWWCASLGPIPPQAARAGLDPAVSAHWLRHAHASHSLDRGAPIHLVQATLGHASVATTGKYLHARPSDSSARYLGRGWSGRSMPPEAQSLQAPDQGHTAPSPGRIEIGARSRTPPSCRSGPLRSDTRLSTFVTPVSTGQVVAPGIRSAAIRHQCRSHCSIWFGNVLDGRSS